MTSPSEHDAPPGFVLLRISADFVRLECQHCGAWFSVHDPAAAVAAHRGRRHCIEAQERNALARTGRAIAHEQLYVPTLVAAADIGRPIERHAEWHHAELDDLAAALRDAHPPRLNCARHVEQLARALRLVERDGLALHHAWQCVRNADAVARLVADTTTATANWRANHGTAKARP